MTDQIWWYLARSSGIVAFALLTASVVLGLLLASGIRPPHVPASRVAELHRGLATTTLIFASLHLAGLVLDDYVEFGLTDLLVPFASGWKPGAVAWGVVGMYLLVAIHLSTKLRSRISTQLWRAVHLSSFTLFWFAAVHGLTAGTDADTGAFRLLSIGAMLTVAVLMAVRLRRLGPAGARPASRSPRAPSARGAGRSPDTPLVSVARGRRELTGVPGGVLRGRSPDRQGASSGSGRACTGPRPGRRGSRPAPG